MCDWWRCFVHQGRGGRPSVKGRNVDNGQLPLFWKEVCGHMTLVVFVLWVLGTDRKLLLETETPDRVCVWCNIEVWSVHRGGPALIQKKYCKCHRFLVCLCVLFSFVVASWNIVLTLGSALFMSLSEWFSSYWTLEYWIFWRQLYDFFWSNLYYICFFYYFVNANRQPPVYWTGGFRGCVSSLALTDIKI